MTRGKGSRPAGDTPPLFTAERRRGAFERAVERQLTVWRAAGHDVGPVMSATLRLQGRAQDLAAADGKSWAIGDANRTMVAALAAFAPADVAPVDEWTRLLEELATADADDTAAIREHPTT